MNDGGEYSTVGAGMGIWGNKNGRLRRPFFCINYLFLTNRMLGVNGRSRRLRQNVLKLIDNNLPVWKACHHF